MSKRKCGCAQEPLLLAEELHSGCSLKMARINSNPTVGSLRISAWRGVEASIKTGDTEWWDDASYKLDQARSLNVAFSEFCSNQILYALMPMFKERAARKQPSQASRSQMCDRLGEVFVRHSESISMHKEVSEAMALYLMARAGVDSDFFLFPASQREDKSSRSPNHNHDMYSIWLDQDGQPKKLPLQLKKRGNGSDYEVPVVNLTETLKPVLTLTHNTSVDALIPTFAREAEGNSTALHEGVLDFAGHCLQSMIQTRLYESYLTDLNSVGIVAASPNSSTV
ncbi:MAG TPA: hypothetical protein VFI74_02145 [Candidatus Saccharimonadales bacterium]|nr:hypothetical protein [Candidatus Saccharimonadales bacterium]